MLDMVLEEDWLMIMRCVLIFRVREMKMYLYTVVVTRDTFGYSEPAARYCSGTVAVGIRVSILGRSGCRP